MLGKAESKAPLGIIEGTPLCCADGVMLGAEIGLVLGPTLNDDGTPLGSMLGCVNGMLLGVSLFAVLGP